MVWAAVISRNTLLSIAINLSTQLSFPTYLPGATIASPREDGGGRRARSHRERKTLDTSAILLCRDRMTKVIFGPGVAHQLMRFGLSSGLSGMLSFLLPIALHEIGGVPERLAVAVGFVSAYIFNFAMLRLFVFRSRNSLRADTLRYLPLNAAFRLAEYGGFLLLEGMLSLGYIASLFIVLTISTVLKFFGYRRVF